MENAQFPVPSLDTWTTIFLLAAAQGVFLCLTIFLKRKGMRQANTLLAIFIALFSLTLMEYVLHWSRYIYYFPQVNTFYLVFVFFFGPLLLLYYKSVESNGQLNWKDYLHFVPGILFFFNRLPLYLSPFEARQAIIIRDIEGLKLLNPPFFDIHQYHEYLINGHLILYCVILFLFLQKNNLWQKSTAETFGVFEIKRKWYRTLLFLYGGFVLANASYYILVKTPFFSQEWDYCISLAMTIIIYTVGYLGYNRTEIFDGKILQQVFLTPKYQNSSLTLSASQSLKDKLLSHFDEHQPYLDNELRLGTLANSLGVSVHHLSQVINEQMGKSFSDFINEYRVNEAKKMLSDPNNEGVYIINIAYDCGFNNKTSFNKAFKQVSGQAPSVYRKKALLSKGSNIEGMKKKESV